MMLLPANNAIKPECKSILRTAKLPGSDTNKKRPVDSTNKCLGPLRAALVAGPPSPIRVSVLVVSPAMVVMIPVKAQTFLTTLFNESDT